MLSLWELKNRSHESRQNTGYHRLARVDGRGGGRLADGDGNVIGWEEQF